MSTVVMVEKDGVACMAADSLTTYGSFKQAGKYMVRPEKILQVGDAYLGFVGLTANRTVLQHVFTHGLKLPDVRDEQELFAFSLQLHRELKEKYFLNTGDATDEAYESSQMTILLLNRFGLFGLFENRSVEQYRRFTAVGSGARVATGAMYAAYELDAPAEDIARLGVEAGGEFDAWSQAPIVIKKLKLDPSWSNGCA